MSEVWRTVEVEILESDMETISDICFDGDLEKCKEEINDYREEEFNEMVVNWLMKFYGRTSNEINI